MITNTKQPHSGEIRVEHEQKTAGVDYTITNEGSPTLCLHCRTQQGNVRMTENIVNALVEKHSPFVLVLETPMQELRYNSRFHSMMRCNMGLYTNNREHKDFFGKLMQTAEAMDSWTFANKTESSVDFYKRQSILKMIRENTTPFEFLSIKEECDYNSRMVCRKGFHEILDAAKSSLKSAPQHKTCLESVIVYIEKTGNIEFQTISDMTNGMRKCVTELIIPSILWLGESHPFVKSIVKTFDKESIKYYQDSTDFLSAFESALKNLNSDKNKQNGR